MKERTSDRADDVYEYRMDGVRRWCCVPGCLFNDLDGWMELNGLDFQFGLSVLEMIGTIGRKNSSSFFSILVGKG